MHPEQICSPHSTNLAIHDAPCCTLPMCWGLPAATPSFKMLNGMTRPARTGKLVSIYGSISQKEPRGLLIYPKQKSFPGAFQLHALLFSPALLSRTRKDNGNYSVARCRIILSQNLYSTAEKALKNTTSTHPHLVPACSPYRMGLWCAMQLYHVALQVLLLHELLHAGGALK